MTLPNKTLSKAAALAEGSDRVQHRLHIIIGIIASILLGAHGARPEGASPTCVIMGKTVWPGHDLSHAMVQLFTDPDFHNRVATARCLSGSGSYVTACQPGEYYLLAFVDLDADGRLTEGDGIGFFGVTDANDPAQKPASLTLEPGKGFDRVDIRVAYVVDAQGKPQAIASEKLAGEVRQVRPISDTASLAGGSLVEITGRIAGFPQGMTAPAWAFAADSPDFGQILSAARVDPKTATFRLKAHGRDIYVACIVDTNKSWSFDKGDLVAIYGLDNTGAGSPSPVPRTESGKARIEFTCSGKIDADGKVIARSGRAVTFLRPTDLPPILTGAFTGPKVPRVILRLFSDARLRFLLAAVPVESDRPFAVAVPPVVGVYVMAIFDADNNGLVSPGDSVGFYGVTDLLADKPRPVLLTPATVVKDINIAACAVMDDAGKLKTISAR